jgi:nucleotide-binding universal stress UspA family protein
MTAKKLSPIVIATDFSLPSLAAVRTGAELAAALKSELILLHVADDRLPTASGRSPYIEAALEQQVELATANLQEYARRHLMTAEPQTVVRVGTPHEVIAAFAREVKAAFIVVATRGYGRLLATLLGSTTERLLHTAPCPVVVARSFDDES